MRVYIVAGEPSGDLLAAGLMKALLRARRDVEFRGVGGESMTAVGTEGSCGTLDAASDVSDSDLVSGSDTDDVSDSGSSGRFKSLFDISEISVMGIFEVLPRLPLILRRLRQTVADIESFEPDVLVTVDSWGFVSALLTRLRRRWRRGGGEIPVVHYVAPQVWAWKEGRAKNVARLVDRLMTLLPDEGRYFEKYGLRCDFVGHPVVERIAQAGIGSAKSHESFRGAVHGDDVVVVSILPGSRQSEVKRLLPVMKKAVEIVAEKLGAGREIGVGIGSESGLRQAARSGDGSEWRQAARSGDGSERSVQIVVPTVAGVEDVVRAEFEDFDIPVRIVTGEMDRYNAFALSDIAIAKSGTVSLELAALGVPHMIAYKFGWMSNLIARLLVKVKFANLLNIIAGHEIIPEFLLRHCRPDLLAESALKLLSSPEIAARQVSEAKVVMEQLRLPDILPSDRAAQIVTEAAGIGEGIATGSRMSDS